GDWVHAPVAVFIEGQVRSFRWPADAIQAGIGMVPQHFLLVPTLRVVENIALGVESNAPDQGTEP
ncbi:MAG: hypothetical protein SNJ68_13505, partial [Cyanobacteriota bacterium]